MRAMIGGKLACGTDAITQNLQKKREFLVTKYLIMTSKTAKEFGSSYLRWGVLRHAVR